MSPNIKDPNIQMSHSNTTTEYVLTLYDLIETFTPLESQVHLTV